MCGASPTCFFVCGTRSPPSSSVAPRSGTNVCLDPNSPVWTSAHSGSPESASRYISTTLPILSPASSVRSSPRNAQHAVLVDRVHGRGGYPAVPGSSRVDRRHRERRGALAAADEAHPLAGRRLHVHGVLGHAERAGERRRDRRPVRQQLRALQQHGGVDVADGQAGRRERRDDVAQQPERVGVLPLRLGVGEVRADVAQACGAEQRVDHRVREHVGVGVAGEPLLVGHLDAAEDQPPPGREAVGVDPEPGADHQPSGSIRRVRPSNTQISCTPASVSAATASS